MGQDTGNEIPTKNQTSQNKLPPIAKPKRTQIDWGITSPKSKIRLTDIITAKMGPASFSRKI